MIAYVFIIIFFYFTSFFLIFIKCFFFRLENQKYRRLANFNSFHLNISVKLVF